jgi:signal transduction histidine kinase
LDDLARHAGVAVHAVRLTADLQRSRERLVAALEEERRRLRRDLHDGLGPQLAAIAVKLEAARNLLPLHPKLGDGLLAELKNQTQVALADIRRLVYNLRPPSLDELGLVSALREHVTLYSLPTPGRTEAGTGDGRLMVDVEAPEKLPALPAAVEVAAYRIALEGLTNVVRHAFARSCIIRLTLAEGMLHLTITDDGRGLPADLRAGVGLISMRERAAELGGTLVLERAPSGGAHLQARLPLMAARA